MDNELREIVMLLDNGYDDRRYSVLNATQDSTSGTWTIVCKKQILKKPEVEDDKD